MKVVHLSTSVSTSSANYRLHTILLKKGIESDILVLHDMCKNLERVHAISGYGFKYRVYKTLAYYLNIIEFLFLHKIAQVPKGMPYTSGILGIDVRKIPLVKKADIIHLHCVNSAFLSLSSLKKLFNMNKPMVITLHDSWFLTGGCHVLNGCHKFSKECHQCPQLEYWRILTTRQFQKKYKIFQKFKNGVLTAPSEWTYKNVKTSKIASYIPCYIIGNTLDYNVFDIMKDSEITEKIGIINTKRKIRLLFGALNSTVTPYKGFSYLAKALEKLKNERPILAENIELNVFGSDGTDNEIISMYECRFWGCINDERKLAAIYNLCDIYVVPSLEDSFNQTVLESCACGTPVVSFKTGGICDIIEHKVTGYLAEYKNIDDLISGILWMIDNNENNRLGKRARKRAIEKFSEDSISKKFIQIYESIAQISTETK